MTEPLTTLIWAASATAVTAMVCSAGLKAWRGWLDLRRYEIAARRSVSDGADPETGTRIEMADMKERLRKLEAIATGVDL